MKEIFNNIFALKVFQNMALNPFAQELFKERELRPFTAS